MILFLTKDLMILSTANSHARSIGQTIKSVSDGNKAIELLRTESVELVLLDLQTPSFVAADFAGQLSLLENKPNVIAFAQHVNTEVIGEAEELFANVMTRGQFNKNLPNIIRNVVS